MARKGRRMGKKGIENGEDQRDDEEVSLDDLPSKLMDLEDNELDAILKGKGNSVQDMKSVKKNEK